MKEEDVGRGKEKENKHEVGKKAAYQEYYKGKKKNR